jgi:cell division protein ZapA
MNSIRVTILGKSYPLKVLEGEEELMEQIAEYVDNRFQLFKKELSTHPEQTIMVLASLSIAEELYALQRKSSETKSGGLNEDQTQEVSAKIRQILGDINA